MTGGDIWVMPALGGTPRKIAKDGNFPSWSPDGTKKVFARRRIGLFEVAASGGETRAIKLATRGAYYPAYTSRIPINLFEDPRNAINVIAATGGGRSANRHRATSSLGRLLSVRDLQRQPRGQ